MKVQRHMALWLVPLAAIAIVILATAPWSETNALTDSHAPSKAEAATLCVPHGIDESLCWMCDPALRDSERMWCTEHDRYEDRCWICHPDLRDPDRLYCGEHGLYEDECSVCRPEVASTPPPSESAATQLFCGEHEVFEAECGICHPELADGLTPGGSLKIRLPSVESARLSGVEANRPIAVESTSSVDAIGEVEYDLNRLAKVTPLVEGVVRVVHVDLGDQVSAGQRLVTLTSPRVAEARAELQGAVAEEESARRALEREQELFARGVSAERDLVDARSRMTTVSARRVALEQNLQDLGIAPEQLRAMARGERTGSTLDLVAPFDGTVIDRSVVIGDVVSPGDELVRVADIRQMWVSVSVPEQELALVSTGQKIDVHSAATGAHSQGVVTWVSSHLDASTRMARIRAAIPNLDGRWKSRMFVDTHISVSGNGPSLAVPASSVHRFGGHPFVFIDLGEGLYEVRRIEIVPGRSSAMLGADSDHALIRSGLVGDERVVTSRSFLVRSEFQKSRLGAGCVD